ncbi:MAG: small subunit ribosomal protein S1, partial [Bradymonadia bacterium]
MNVAPLPSIEELAAHLEAWTAKPGTAVDAVVARVEGEAVLLTFEGGTGHAPLAEFGKPPAPGDTCRAYVDEYAGDAAVLSLHKAARIDVFSRLQAAQEAGTPLHADVLRVVRGGLSVQVFGVKVFLAANNLAERPARLEDWLQKSLEVRVLTLDGFKGRVEVAHADVKIESPEEVQARIFEELEVGAIVHGTVRRFAQFGAFVDLGGYDGLVPTAELCWGRIR